MPTSRSPSEQPWYSGETLTRANVLVRVRWGWMPPFEAMLVKADPRLWAGQIGGQMVRLPPRVQRVWRSNWGGEDVEVTNKWLEDRGWGAEPIAWQPLRPRDWPEPLPEPLPVSGLVDDAPRMTSIGGVAFDATAAAAEMEAEREEARSRREEEQDEFRPDGRPWDWWRNPALVKYEPRGEVTRDMAEARLLRATAFCRGDLELSMLRGHTAATALASAIAVVIGNEVEIPTVRFSPLQQDHGDFLEAMRWFAKLGDDQLRERRAWGLSMRQEVVVLRSLPRPRSFREIAIAFAMPLKSAHRLYTRAIDSVYRSANETVLLDVRIAALRERNRAHKRSQ